MSNAGRKNKTNWLQQYRRTALIGGPLVVLIIGLVFYVLSGRYVSTDNAYTQAAKSQINSNIAGQVIKIHVHDNDRVRKGDILFEIDNRPFKLIVEEAQAQLASKQLEIKALKATYRKYQADLKTAINTSEYLKREFKRQEKLFHIDVSSKAQIDKAKNDLDIALQQIEVNKHQLANVQSSLNEDPNIPIDQHPIVQQAYAQLNQAKLNLSYTIIRAPLDGIVTKVEQLQVGDYIKLGTPIFSLIAEENIWVEANFKETELTYIKPDQEATIYIDLYPEKTFVGKVVSVSPGTGSSFSLLPPENATGNWVKVVQRVPVRISINNKGPEFLGAGLSAYVKVDTGRQRSTWFNQ